MKPTVEVSFDSRDSRSIPITALRAQMESFPRMSSLFGGTIRENIAYGSRVQKG